jgi:hypothetical protein
MKNKSEQWELFEGRLEQNLLRRLNAISGPDELTRLYEEVELLMDRLPAGENESYYDYLNIVHRVVRKYRESEYNFQIPEGTKNQTPARPPFNAEYLLYFFLRKEEREIVIGDLVESYSQILGRFDKRRADIWFYKQAFGSVLPLLRRALLKIGALVWLGRILRRLVS